jgi:peptide/nickel transport system permease protein
MRRAAGEMPMFKVLLSRLGQAALVMLVVSAVSFVMFRYVGDPVATMSRENASVEEKAELRRSLGLDQPLVVQYGRFLTRTLSGDLGISYRNQRPVTELIAERLPATLELVIVATFLSLALGIPLGVLCALKPNGVAARLVQALSLVGISTPTFVTGIVLILVFAVSLGWLPSFGRGQVVDLGWWSTGFLTISGLKSLLLPGITLALYQLTLIMRLVRAEMIDVLSSDYIRFAKARGLPTRYIHFRLALRNALMPVITVTGLQIGSLIAFAIVTETVFQWPGMGLLFIQAVSFVDIPVMAAYLLFVGLLFVLINTVVDILYAVVDPRLRARSA